MFKIVKFGKGEVQRERERGGGDLVDICVCVYVVCELLMCLSYRMEKRTLSFFWVGRDLLGLGYFVYMRHKKDIAICRSKEMGG
jgi:hypothetical protein